MHRVFILTLLFILSYFVSYSQEWIRIYGNNINAHGNWVIETYDNGYVIISEIKLEGTSKLGWIIKTDINGEILWDKKIGNGSFLIGPSGIQQTSDGGYIIIGTTGISDPAGDAFILKLDKCGEKEWCKIFNTWGDSDYGRSIKQLPDSNYIGIIRYFGYDIINKRIWLFKLNQNGEIIWTNYYAQNDPNIINEEGYFLTITSDSNYLITGKNYYQLVPGSGLYWRQPYWIKVDKNGEQVWDLTWGLYYDQFTGEASQSVINSSGDFYSTGRHETLTNGDKPCLFKFDRNGNPIFYKNTMEDTDLGVSGTITWLNDSSLVMGTVWKYEEGDCQVGVIETDTMGNLIKIKELINEDNNIGCSLLTFDKKLLLLGSFYNGPGWDIYLFKLNQDLEYDSIYTQSFTYDSLCEHAIVSDTIDLDCDVVVNIPKGPEKETTAPLKIWPNPTTGELHIDLPECIVSQSADGFFQISHFNHQYQDKSMLQFFNIFGRKVYEFPLAKGQRKITLDVSFLTNGIYIIRLVYKGGTVSSGRFVKR